MMIKKLIILLLFTFNCFAVQYSVFIDKIGFVSPGEEAGHTELGDVVVILPNTSKPTRAELDRYLILIINLTDEEKKQLLEKIEGPAGYDFFGKPLYRTIKARKNKFDFENIAIKNIKDLNEVVITDVQKTIILDAIVDKSN